MEVPARERGREMEGLGACNPTRSGKGHVEKKKEHSAKKKKEVEESGGIPKKPSEFQAKCRFYECEL